MASFLHLVRVNFENLLENSGVSYNLYHDRLWDFRIRWRSGDCGSDCGTLEGALLLGHNNDLLSSPLNRSTLLPINFLSTTDSPGLWSYFPRSLHLKPILGFHWTSDAIHDQLVLLRSTIRWWFPCYCYGFAVVLLRLWLVGIGFRYGLRCFRCYWLWFYCSFAPTCYLWLWTSYLVLIHLFSLLWVCFSLFLAIYAWSHCFSYVAVGMLLWQNHSASCLVYCQNQASLIRLSF